MVRNREGIAMKQPTRREFLQSTGQGALTAALMSGGRASAASARRPNILLFFPDQQRPDWTQFNPDVPVPTPNIAALAARGTRFTDAICPSPLCAPSRACLAAGKEYDRCGVPSNSVDYPKDQTTFYTRLREGGYRVLGCGKFDLHKPRATWGLDGKTDLQDWGFTDGIDNAGKWDGWMAYAARPRGPKDPYYAYLNRLDPPLAQVHYDDMATRRKDPQQSYGNTGPTPIPDAHYIDNWIGRNGLALIDATPVGDPWFMQVNFNGPHEPNDITDRMHRGYYGPARIIDGFPQPHHGDGELNAATHVRVRQNYSALIENIDRMLGLYLRKLEERGELDNTIVVYSSDHGEMLGDHGRWGKNQPYQASAGVPLVVAGPGVRTGSVNDRPQTTLDLTATFLDYAGIARPDDMDSRSLRPVLEADGATHREVVLSGLDAWRLAYDGRYKLIRGPLHKGDDSDITLFDLEADPQESANVAADHPEVVERLSAHLPKA
jgi:choline-sulfatase